MDSKPPPADSLPLIGLLLAAAVLLTLSALFSVSESSFLSMNKLRLRIRRKSGDRRAIRVSRLLEKKDVLINTLLAANDLVNILLSSILAAAALHLFGDQGVGIAAVVTTVILLVFGEITPKTISVRNPDAIAYALSGFVTVVVTVFKPVATAFTAIAHGILRFAGVNTGRPKQSYTEQDIMVPRMKIIAVPNTVTYRALLEKAQSTRLSRFPVYRGDIDDIIGVVYVKDLLAYRENAASFMVQNVMREPLFILGTKKMSSVQQMLRENRQSLAIVIDEYSGTDGILTQDDITREIVGITGSGYSRRGRIPLGKIKNTSDFTVSGNTLLSDLEGILHLPFESSINETIGGWMEEKLDRMPLEGDAVSYSGYRFTALSVDTRRIGQVHIQSTAADEPEEEE